MKEAIEKTAVRVASFKNAPIPLNVSVVIPHKSFANFQQDSQKSLILIERMHTAPCFLPIFVRETIFIASCLLAWLM